MKKYLYILMLLLFCSFATATTTDLNNGLLVYYKFEENGFNYLDESTNNVDITTGTNPDRTANGIINYGQDFERTNLDYIYSGSDATLEENVFTVNFWVKFESIGVTQRLFVFGERPAATSYGYYISLTDTNKIQYYGFYTDGDGVRTIQSTNTFTTGTWYNVILSHNAGSITLYVNNVSQTFSTDAGTGTNLKFNPGSQEVTLGDLLWAGAWEGNYFDGIIDEVAVFNYILSADDREFLYNSGVPTTSQQYPFDDFVPFSTTLISPNNTTVFYGDYNGSIYIELNEVNISAWCNINDSRFTLENTIPLGNETIIFQNNTILLDSNISVFINCTDGGGATSNQTIWFYLDTILDIYFYDESTLDLLNETITFDLITSGFVQNYTTQENLSIASLIPGIYEISYKSPGYITRQDYLSILEGHKHTLYLYLINSSLVTQIIPTLYDEFGNKLVNYYIYTYRRILGNYYHIETSKTNSDGQTDFYAILNTPMYYWLIKDSEGTLYEQTSETEIYGTSLDFNIVLSTPIDHIFSHIGTHSYSLTFNNATNVWTYIFNDASGSSTYNKLAVYKLSDGSLIGENGTTSTAGTLSVDLTGLYENGSTYIARVSANASPEFSIDSRSYTYFDYPFELGEIGLFMTINILIVLAFVGIWNPAVMFILESIAVIFTWIIGLHKLSFTATISITAIMLIMAYVVSDRT